MRVLRSIARTWAILLGCTAATLTLGLAVRLLLPLAPWNTPPALVEATPADGAADVLPRSAITLRFSQPMNRQAALGALRIDPPTPGSLSWSPDARALTFQPSPALSAAVTYTVTLDRSALGQWWRAIEAPAQLRFRTAPPPAVVAALPAGAGVALDGSIAMVFSQPMVPADRVGMPADLPQLSFTPPLPADGVWVAADTLLLRPRAPLRAATAYTATIAPELSDLRGVELGRPFSWGFSTGWPQILAREPAPDARWVSPRQPLRLTLSAPIAPELLRQALVISPTVAGDLRSDLIGGTQVLTFTPSLGWAPDRSYQVALVAPPGSGLAAPPEPPWRFSVEPLPALVAFFPGQGQILPAGQAVRLVFSTPMDAAALAAGLQIDPPVAEVPIGVSDAEVRLRPSLRPSTLYTITVAAGTPDRSGEPLAAPISVQLRTPPAAPQLRAPAAPSALLSLPISRTATIDIERVNLAALSLSLYQLDAPTLLRALALRPAEWPGFRPERYGQALARQWRVDLGDPLDAIARTALPIDLGDGAALAPGAYYLRITTIEGPRLDLLLLVTPLQLVLRQTDSQLLIWAADAQTSAPVAGAPIAVYAGAGLVARGSTGPDGLLTLPIARAPRGPPLLALAEGPAPAVAQSDWLAAQPLTAPGPRYRSLLLLDRLSYRPGATVQILGYTRHLAASGALGLPVDAPLCRLQIVTAGGQAPPAGESRCGVAPGGQVLGSLRLDPQTAPGDYTIRAMIGDEQTILPLRVQAEAPELAVTVRPSGADALDLSVARANAPVAGAVVSWSLELEPLTLPAIDGFQFGGPPAPPSSSAGGGQTDSDGLLRVPLPAASQGWRYRVSATVTMPGAPAIVMQSQGQARPAGPSAGLRLPSRIIAGSERSLVELLAIGVDGRPAPGVAVDIEVLRRDLPGEAPLLSRRATTGADGRAGVRLVQLRPGAYAIVARVGAQISRSELWVFAERFVGWANPAGQVGLIPDQAAYRPGDVARLLITTPYPSAGLLLTQEQGVIRSAETRALRAGQLITVTITPEMAPGLTIGAVLSAAGEYRVGAVSLPVLADSPPLTATLASDRRDYRPAASATLTVTLASQAGPASADLLVAITPADEAADAEAPQGRLRAGQAAPSGVALFPPPPAPPPVAAPAAARGLPGAARELSAGAGADGVIVGRVPLPDRPGRWRISVYALSGADRLAVASAVVTTSVPLELRPAAPAALRPGDRAEASLELRNISPTTLTLTVDLLPQGVVIADAASPSRRVLLAPGGAQRVAWPIALGAAAGAPGLRFRVSGPGISEERALDLAAPSGPAPAGGTGRTLLGSGPLTATLVLSPTADLTIALAPGLRATLLESAAALIAQQQRSLDDEASLLLISGALARTADAPEGERWAAVAAEAAARLRAAQSRDGGWGWWPGAPSEPFVSALAVEALATARDLDAASPPLPQRALRYLAQAAPAAAPDLRAMIAYALGRAGEQPDLANIQRAELSPAGLAYLALAAPGAGADGSLQLTGAAEAGAAPSAPALPQDRASLAALTLQATRDLGQGAQTQAAERALQQSWGVGGWPSPYAAARVAVALPAAPAAPAVVGGPRRLTLDGETLMSGPISGTLRLTLPAAQREQPIGRGHVLLVESVGPAPYMLAYQLTPGAAPPATPSLIVRYRDPAGGLRDPASLRVGEAVELELTLIVVQPLRRAELRVSLPAGLILRDSAAPAPLRALLSDPAGRALLFGAAPLGPGVYTIRIGAQVGAAGSFAAPPIQLVAPYESPSATLSAPLPAIRAIE